jgi:hypothetical protein
LRVDWIAEIVSVAILHLTKIMEICRENVITGKVAPLYDEPSGAKVCDASVGRVVLRKIGVPINKGRLQSKQVNPVSESKVYRRIVVPLERSSSIVEH